MADPKHIDTHRRGVPQAGREDETLPTDAMTTPYSLAVTAWPSLGSDRIGSDRIGSGVAELLDQGFSAASSKRNRKLGVQSMGFSALWGRINKRLVIIRHARYRKGSAGNDA
jgi:hypothetical protein